MKLTLPREPFLAAYSLAAGVVPRQTPKPVLRNVKLTTGPDGGWLEATDLEVGLRIAVADVVPDAPGSVLLSARVGAVLRVSPDGHLSIEVEPPGDSLTVRGDRSVFTLPTEDPALFPAVPPFDAPGWFALEARDVRRAIRRTVFATDVESTRFALGGVLLEPSPSGLTWVATDGRRLAKLEVPAACEGSPPTTRPVVPVKALKVADRLLADAEPDAPVRLAFTAQAFLLEGPSGSLYSRLVEGRFPKWEDVFPSVPPSVATTFAGALLLAADQASIVTSEESRGVDFDFGPDLLTLRATSADVGRSDVPFPLHYDGPAASLALDVRYLRDFLKALDPSQEVRIEVIDGKNAILFKCEGDYTYVVMPLTRDR